MLNSILLASILFILSGCSSSQFSGETGNNPVVKPQGASPGEADYDASQANQNDPDYDTAGSGPLGKGFNQEEVTPGCSGNIAVALVVDTSASMRWQPGVQVPDAVKQACANRSGLFLQNNNGNKMAAAKESAGAFIKSLGSGDFVGLAKFSDSAIIVDQLTRNKKSVLASLDTLAPERCTNVSDALEKGREMLNAVSDSNLEKIIVVLSDGEPTVGGNPKALAEDIKDLDGIKIAAVGYQLNEPGRQVMSSLASSEDYYFDAPNTDELLNQFRRLARKVCEN